MSPTALDALAVPEGEVPGKEEPCVDMELEGDTEESEMERGRKNKARSRILFFFEELLNAF